MANSPETCECNDYSRLTGNTGLATISTASPALDGTGSVLVLTAAPNGTTIKSVTIKATQPTTTGMVRLFIGDGTHYSLYKEVPIPNNPVLTNTPTPPVVLPMFETTIEGGFKMANGFFLYASTQNAESFNIIAEGLDWTYPMLPPNPPTCCNFINNIANNGIKTINIANSNLDGSGSVLPVLTTNGGSEKGTTVKNIVIKATQNTHPGMVRLYIYDGVANYYLFKEVLIPETNPTSCTPTFKQIVSPNLSLGGGLSIYASTEVGEGFAITAEAMDWKYA